LSGGLFVFYKTLGQLGGHSAATPLAAKPRVSTPRTTAKKNKTAHRKTTVSTVHAATVSLQTTSQSGGFLYVNYAVSQLPVTAAVTFSGDCWATYWINGVAQPGKMYYAGQNLRISGSQSVEISLGTHLATVDVNGRSVALPAPNYVLDMTFTGH
jgi:hypothetical protein